MCVYAKEMLNIVFLNFTRFFNIILCLVSVRWRPKVWFLHQWLYCSHPKCYLIAKLQTLPWHAKFMLVVILVCLLALKKHLCPPVATSSISVNLIPVLHMWLIFSKFGITNTFAADLWKTFFVLCFNSLNHLIAHTLSLKYTV